MTNEINQPCPPQYLQIAEATKEAGFTMASDILTGSLLKTLAASKPGGSFLELGTGTGLSSSWILSGMDATSTLVSVDNDERVLAVAKTCLGYDRRLTLVCSDGELWLNSNKGAKFDFIFADTWHGKYLMIADALAMLKRGGLYIVDDMLPQPNWPEGHDKKTEILIGELEAAQELVITRLSWSTGIIIGTKII